MFSCLVIRLQIPFSIPLFLTRPFSQPDAPTGPGENSRRATVDKNGHILVTYSETLGNTAHHVQLQMTFCSRPRRSKNVADNIEQHRCSTSFNPGVWC